MKPFNFAQAYLKQQSNWKQTLISQAKKTQKEREILKRKKDEDQKGEKL